MKQIPSDHCEHKRSGFTLTEMLVAVGLLLVIMTIFGQIFQMAVTAMTRQKGLANNDQRSRTVFTVIDTDLKRISYRSISGQGGIVPLAPGLRYHGKAAAPNQRGYIYYSENDPYDETDDVLQFTLDAELIGATSGGRRYAGQSPLLFYGKAKNLNPTGGRDQPDWDDGVQDNISVSRWAEVSYFLRNGTLYRRVMLIRDTDDGKPLNMQVFDRGDSRKLAQPAFPDSDERYPIDMMRSDIGSPYDGNFYSEFDFSAHFGVSPYDEDLDPMDPYLGLDEDQRKVAVFHGSLSNESQRNWPLGIPHFRFGFDHVGGRPKEFIASSGNYYFMGRYTHEETSHAAFQFPHRGSGVNPFTRNDFDIDYLLRSGRLNHYSGHVNGTRRGADILMNNVQSFNVEIWDPTANNNSGGFVSLGGNNSDTLAASQRLTDFGPVVPAARRFVFDSWNSSLRTGSNAGPWPGTPGFGGMPPLMPVVHHPVGLVPVNVDALSGAGQPYAGKVGHPLWSSDPAGVGSSSNPIFNNMIIFPSTALSPSEATAWSVPYGHAVFWRAVLTYNNNPVPDTMPVYYVNTAMPPVEPTWGHSVEIAGDGTLIEDPNGLNFDGSSASAPGLRLEWRSFDNRRGIPAIRITVRFLDPASQQIKQMTMLHSLNEDGAPLDLD